MTEIRVARDEPKAIAELAASLGLHLEPHATEPNDPGVYGTFWQARSGYFKLAAKLVTGDTGRSLSKSP